ncbi:N-acetylglucosaminyl-diphospho-decaprenol L-rhamnosyltransferase [Synechococcus sp. CBW1107]|nr:N-acetylglucosaminyl-diphospho-decaprenol L-rhamnosyltransferase [Synechococcus sp. CBW1107]
MTSVHDLIPTKAIGEELKTGSVELQSPLNLQLRQLQLIVVAFHPGEAEVAELKSSLASLPLTIGYSIVSNDHRPNEPVESLAESADLFLPQECNLGYGRAVNLAVQELRQRGLLSPFLGALNTDLRWETGSLKRLLAWLQCHPEVVLAVPRICDPSGNIQSLCKRDPTVLALISRRFIPRWIKPCWLRRYDSCYVMAECDYEAVLDVPYLSGCCMLMRSKAFEQVGGFDEDFFLYLEDADLTRQMRAKGRTVHLPVASVIHTWGRGNHRSWRLTLVNLKSAWIYFRKWGFSLW